MKLKLQVYSDLHLEFLKQDRAGKFIDDLPTGGDALVLAGDIHLLSQINRYEYVLRKFTEKWPRVFYVPGNHEFYGGSFREGWGYLNGHIQKLYPNLTVLQSGVVTEFMGKKFIGDTMWFPYDEENDMFKRDVNDFEVIRDAEPGIYDRHNAFLEFVQRECDQNTVVITHHTPSAKSIPTEFRGSPINGFFCAPHVEQIILDKQPLVWIHGHTHTAFDYQINKTRVVCNPRGYSFEQGRNGFDLDCAVEIL